MTKILSDEILSWSLTSSYNAMVMRAGAALPIVTSKKTLVTALGMGKDNT